MRTAETIEQDARALRLRVARLTYRQIGDALGIAELTARLAVERRA